MMYSRQRVVRKEIDNFISESPAIFSMEILNTNKRNHIAQAKKYPDIFFISTKIYAVGTH